MTQRVTPLPAIGEVFSGRDADGREMRISSHPDSDRVVLSIWQDGRCQATVRLARADIPHVTRVLVSALVPPSGPVRGSATSPQRPGTVHQLRPTTGSWATTTVPLTPQTLRELTERIATYLPPTVGARLRQFSRRRFSPR